MDKWNGNDDVLPSDSRVSCDCTAAQKEKFAGVLKKLEAYYPKNFDATDGASVGKFIQWVTSNRFAVSRNLTDKENLEILDSLQHHAPWTRFKLKWLSGSLKLNQKTHPLFDADAADEVYTGNYHELFATASFSINFMKIVNNNSNIRYFSPTLSYSNSRDFDEDSLLVLQSQEDFQISPGTSIKLIDATSFYREKAKRKNQFGIELPYVIYYPKSGFGLDLGMGIKFSDKLNDVYGRFGVYLPISTGDDDVVTIEPIIKINKLNKSHLSFIKDMFSLGFNISVSIPKFLKEDN